MKRIEKVFEEAGIKLEINEGSVLVEFWTDTAGQDIPVEFEFDGTPRDFIEKFSEQADAYDVDENVELYVNMRGQNGIPNTVRELLDDCQEAKDTLMEIKEALENCIVTDANKNDHGRTLLELDKQLFIHFHPAEKLEELNFSDSALALRYIVEDLDSLLVDFAEEEVLEFYKKAAKDLAIASEVYVPCFEEARKSAMIRKDWATALRRAKKGTDLSHKIRYALSKADIKELAKLHLSNKFRRKIEDLLEDCNFHAENSDFIDGKYENYL